MHNFSQTTWFSYLQADQQAQIELSFRLYEREIELQSNFHDYSFIIFPLSKAYEGFLKQYLYDLELIDQRTYEGTRFRIGRALNPDVNASQKQDWWLYDEIAHRCGSELARQLWDAWLECRNRIFHYYPTRHSEMSMLMIKKRMEQVVSAIEAAIMCAIDGKLTR